jgi:anti-sigma B factor antagonist
MGTTFDIDAFRVDGRGMSILISKQGTTSTLELVGECDLAQRDDLRAAIGGVLVDRPECLVLDLSRLAFIDSSGIHVMIELSERAARQECRLLICPGPRAVQRVFELCGLTTRLPFVGEGAGSGQEPRDAAALLIGAAGSGGSSSPPAANAAGRPTGRPAAPPKQA